MLDSNKIKTISLGDVVERKLNLADTEGMFLLMAVGYIMAGSVLFSEIVGGCAKSCRALIRRNSETVQNNERHGNKFSFNQFKPKELTTFPDKLRSEIRRRIRTKPKDEPEVEETKDGREPKWSGEEDGVPEAVLKGFTPICIIKRIMWMRKMRKDKRTAKEVNKNTVIEVIAKESNEVSFRSNLEDFMMDNSEKCNEDLDDDGSLLESSSVFSEIQMIREKTEAEINQPSIPNRVNNPSEEFGEIV